MTVQSIIKKAIKRLEVEGKILTPDFYTEAFCKEAKIAGMVSEDCSHVEKHIKTINKDFQKELRNYRIKTLSELSRFLVSKLNRTNSTQCSEILESQIIFTKRVLQVVEVLHNEEATLLAKKSIELIESRANASQIDQFRQLWINFITTYDDTFLSKLKSLGKVDTTNLRKTIENLNIDLTSSGHGVCDFDPAGVASILATSLVPSIASSVNDKIATLSQKIQNEPSILDSKDIQSEIKSAISLRISLDKQSVKEMIESLDSVLDKLSLRLIDMIERSDSSTLEIKDIKKELESYSDEASSNFKIAHKKLFTIASALEENTQLLSRDLTTHNSEVKILSKRVHELEMELEEAKQESKEDFLTKLYNKRALDEFMQVKEGEYERYGRDFSVVMFDLDHFKAVNDNYGHDAGDAILSAFASILKKEARSVDVVGRFGGEEFMALLSNTDIDGGVSFAQKVRKHVQKAKFMYKGKRIELTVSAGVAQRKQHSSLKAAINSADESLYEAKNNGRNRVEYKN
jgi:diguanylate cyclase (GGDEF)-like protein